MQIGQLAFSFIIFHFTPSVFSLTTTEDVSVLRQLEDFCSREASDRAQLILRHPYLPLCHLLFPIQTPCLIYHLIY